MGGNISKNNKLYKNNNSNLNQIHLATLRMIFKNETAQNSFLYFLNEILQNNTFNLFNNFIYFDIFDNLLEYKKNNLPNYGLNYKSYFRNCSFNVKEKDKEEKENEIQRESKNQEEDEKENEEKKQENERENENENDEDEEYGDEDEENESKSKDKEILINKLENDIDLNINYLKQLQSIEQYLMIISVISVLNTFMRSEWHSAWQKIEMQFTDPAPQIFPPLSDRICDKFSIYEEDLRYFFKTIDANNVLDLLLGSLKHLPFPFVVMEMTQEKEWFPIEQMNSSFLELTGYSEEEIRGQTIRMFHRHIDLELVKSMRLDMLSGHTSKATILITRKDGIDVKCVLGVIPILDHHETISHFIALLDNITTPDYCLSRLKVFSDLVDSISSDINVPPPDELKSNEFEYSYLI